jgi:hypothetical protein
MKRITFLAAIIAGFFLFGAQSALADDCALLSGSPAGAECVVSTTRNVSGTFTIAETLHITGTGKIITGGAALTINITPSGDFLMNNGALIDAGLATQATGGAITITLADGDVDLDTGSIIRSNAQAGGPIKIQNDNTPKHTMDLDGTIESVGSNSGGGNSQNQGAGGGPITIVAGCELTVSDSGLVSSRGLDPGADLVHLQGCTVVIDGIVESTGPGHVLPVKNFIPITHCNDDLAAHPVGGASFFSGCVEVWGNTVTINSIAPQRRGAYRSPWTTQPRRGWIDVFASGDITINNNTTFPIPCTRIARPPTITRTRSAGSSRSSPTSASSRPAASRCRPTARVWAPTAAT